MSEYIDVDLRSKPPLGVVPKEIWIQKRITYLNQAIQRQLEFEGCRYGLVAAWAREISQLVDMLTEK